MASVNWAGEIAAYLNLGADSTTARGGLLASLGGAVQGSMERYIGRHLDVQTHTEAYDGRGRPTLFLRWDPVLSVSSLSVNGATYAVDDPRTPAYPPSEVVIYGTSGIKWATGGVFPTGTGNIIVTYSAGFDVVPPEIIQAGVSWAALLFRERDRAGISSQGAGGQSASFIRDMPPYVKTVLDSWVRWDKSC